MFDLLAELLYPSGIEFQIKLVIYIKSNLNFNDYVYELCES